MMDHALTSLQRWLRAHALFYRLTLGTRVLLAVGFIPTGMVKLLGLYLSGPYRRFLGLAQVLAGVLVLVPATATLGALMFFTIMINVFIITLSYEFHFTPFVTGAMLTATLYLLVWDYDRLRGLVGFGASSEAESRPMPRHRLSGPVERGAYIAGALAGLGFFFGTRGLFVPWSWNQWFLLVCGISLVVALWFGLVRRARPVGSGLE